MKRNVDLTENRIFSMSDFRTIQSTVHDIFFGKLFPWDIFIDEINIGDELDFDYQRKSIIAVGNKEIRAKIKLYREMDSLDYCDCCGERMNLKPWDREIGICHKCDNYYSRDEDKCSWRKLTREVIRNANII